MLALAPYNGMIQALIRARIPYLAVHADHIDRDAGQFSVLVLPNLAAMSTSQVEAVRRFVSKGGSLIATDETSLYDDYGDPRPDFALADVFGASYTGKTLRSEEPGRFAAHLPAADSRCGTGRRRSAPRRRAGQVGTAAPDPAGL